MTIAEARFIARHPATRLVVIKDMQHYERPWDRPKVIRVVDLRYSDMKDTLPIATLTPQFKRGVGESIADQLQQTGQITKCTWTVSSVEGCREMAMRKTQRAPTPSPRLVIAGGFCLAGCLALALSAIGVRAAKEEQQQAIEAMRDAETEQELAIRRTVDALMLKADRERREGPLTFAQRASIEQTLRAAPEEIRMRIGELAITLGGAKGFGPGAGEFTGAELEALARLGFQLPAETSRESASRAEHRRKP